MSLIDYYPLPARKTQWGVIRKKRAQPCPVPKVSLEELSAKAEEFAAFTNGNWTKKSISLPLIHLCYQKIRDLRPELVVETGCFGGITTALVLLALKHNARGTLVTIDLPTVNHEGGMALNLPEGEDVGFLVPEELRSPWKLIKGDSKEHLLTFADSAEVFIHDSDHTYEHMMWELTTMHRTPCIFCDDIGMHTAFWDFCDSTKRRMEVYKENPSFAMCVKA